MKFFFVAAFFGLSFVSFSQSLFDKAIAPLTDSTLMPFCFGVASGDPQPDGVIIWTKLWSDDLRPSSVAWEVATDTLMEHVVASGNITADSSSAYTVKIQLKGLNPGTIYFYRFKTGDNYSPVGRTKTAHVNQAQNIRFGVVSCSNYEQGFFNVYRLLAQRNDLDAVLHLGDYIYEYGTNRYSKKLTVRNHIPDHEIVTLQDYRTRYAQYRLDKDLQEAHRLHPFITVWDDHEFANNSFKEGAKNHQPEEGDWEIRKSVAKKAYFEWLPITDNEEQSIVRRISYGNLADVFMIDSRLEGRCEAASSPYDTILSSTDRRMLGHSQCNWLLSGIYNSPARWKVIGNQVVFSELDAHKVSKKYAVNTDAWDGYPAERQEILDSLYRYGIKNVIVVTGDIHTSWAFDLVQDPKDKNRYNPKTGAGVIGAEFVTPSVSSGNLSARVPRGLGKLLGGLLKRKATNPHLRFQNVVDHGYILLDLNEERAQATWVFTKTVKVRTDKISSRKSWSTQYDNNRLMKSEKLNRALGNN